MNTVEAADGTRLAYHRTGDGSPLVCVPGGPTQSSNYLGDLGGVSPMARLDLLGHSAGAALAVSYAARHPDRVRRLVLVTPTPFVVGLEITDADPRRPPSCAAASRGSRRRSPRSSGSGPVTSPTLTARASRPSTTGGGTP